MKRRNVIIVVGLLVGLVLGGAIFLTTRAVVVRVRATPRPTIAPLARASAVATPVPTKVLTPAAAEASISSLDGQVRIVASRVGYDKYEWTLLSLPATTTSDQVLQYYTSELQKSGWNGKMSTYKNDAGNLVGVWTEPETRSGLAIIYIASTTTTFPYVVVINGEELPEKPTPDF